MTRHVVIAGLLLLAACTKSNMDSQPKYHEYERSGLFENGSILQPPPEGSVARDHPTREAEGTGTPPLDLALLRRGRERFDIFCAPCHGRTGSGNGIVVQRGMPRPPSLHDQRLLAAVDRHFYDVISHGYGAMYSYSARVSSRDRWAIVAYIRALQMSQHASLSDLTPEERSHLGAIQ